MSAETLLFVLFVVWPIVVFVSAFVAGVGWRLGRGPSVVMTWAEHVEHQEHQREERLAQLVDPKEQL